MREYIDLKQQGPAGTEKLNSYLIAVIDAIGMSNEEIVANRHTPIFCQGQRDISVEMVRAILDRWIQKTEPTKTPAEWKVFVGKQNLAGAVLYSLKVRCPVADGWAVQSAPQKDRPAGSDRALMR